MRAPAPAPVSERPSGIPARLAAIDRLPGPRVCLLSAWGYRLGGPDRHPVMPTQDDISEEIDYYSMKRLRAFVSGTVQMTGYRAKVVNLANFLGLVGFVQNLPDGRVKVVAEGDDSTIERFLKDLRIKDSLIDVQSIEVYYTSAMGDFIRFEKIVSDSETDPRLDRVAEMLKDIIRSLDGLQAEVSPN